MPRFGDLAPLGVLRFGADETDAEKFYRSQKDALKRAFDVSEGTHVEASIYARSLGFARARAEMRHGRDQKHPSKAVEMLPALERAYRVSPLHGQSDEERRGVVAARKLLSRGNRRESLEAAIVDIVGADNFVSLRTITTAEAVQWPAAPGNVGAFEAPNRAQRLFRLLDPVASVGAATVRYEHASGADDGTRILKGERYCFGAENTGLAEALTITAADTTAKTVTATFAKSKDVGSFVSSYHPLVTSTQRTLIVGLSSSAARNPVTRRLLDDLLRRMARSITRWFIVEETTPGEAGPFVVGSSIVGVTPIGAAAFAL